MTLLALQIYRKNGSPVFFRQLRAGKNGSPFSMLKFRTMISEPSLDSHTVLDAARITSYGRFLRASSLDELPELWNVLKGEMSLVGPRPLLLDYLPLYTQEQARRHEVRPGITGWAQVNGRNTINWADKFKLDVWYVDNQSLILDVKIIARTLKQVIMREGISFKNQEIMPKFTGNE